MFKVEGNIYVTRSSMPPIEEYIEEIQELWDNHWLTNMGEKHCLLEEKLKDYLNVNGVSLFCNGHMALEMTLQSMRLSGEVITTPFTFASTTHAIIRNGLTPVFCDINSENFTMDINRLESLITERTTAIVPVHVYGNLCDVESIEQIAHKHHLKVIYDAAHAFGVKYKGRSVASFGDASMFSFHATKVFHSIEGGAVCFSNEELGLNLYRLKNFGIRDEETIDAIGANAKMNEFQAAMGLCNLRHLNEEIIKRKNTYERYIEQLSDIRGLIFPKQQEYIEYNYAYFPIVIEKNAFGISRDELHDILKENGIYARKYFYPLTSAFDCYQGLFDTYSTPIAMQISNQILTLPLYADLSIESVDRICSVIRTTQRKVF